MIKINDLHLQNAYIYSEQNLKLMRHHRMDESLFVYILLRIANGRHDHVKRFIIYLILVFKALLINVIMDSMNKK